MEATMAWMMLRSVSGLYTHIGRSIPSPLTIYWLRMCSLDFTLCCILTRNVDQVCLSVSPIQLAYIVELLDTNCKDHLHWGVSNCCDVSIVEAHDFLSPCMCPSLVNACIAIITALTDSGQSWSLLLYQWFLCHDNNQHNVLVAQPHLMMLKHLPSSTK